MSPRELRTPRAGCPAARPEARVRTFPAAPLSVPVRQKRTNPGTSHVFESVRFPASAVGGARAIHRSARVCERSHHAGDREDSRGLVPSAVDRGDV